MLIKPLLYVALLFAGLTNSVAAQQEPLSVIDWVKRNPDQPPMTSAVLPPRFEPPVAPDARVPDVTVAPLEQQARRIIGIVPASVTGLPETLWTGSSAPALAAQFTDLPNLRLPAAQALLYTLLLTEAIAPGQDADGEATLTLARVNALERLGAHDGAIALLEQADVARDSDHFAAYMDLALLTGEEDRACAILSGKPYLSPSLAHRSFCAARRGDWPTAALLYDTGHSLGAIPAAQGAALERFLHPEAFEYNPPLPRPDKMTPLIFRLHEAIGEPFPTGALPRSYAVADLRDLAGWKPQLEAAERLAATGALSANRLLGLYTAREPAASGGVWNRVIAIQNLETALRSRSIEAIEKNLPPAWLEMQKIGLEIQFAELFSSPLQRYDLTGMAGDISQTMGLLSSEYRDVARKGDVPPLMATLAGVERQMPPLLDTRATALQRGLDVTNARADLTDMARNGRMGEAILRALVLLDDGASGDPLALTQALATLRVFGLEETVRRAALQILLLERYS
ncbi:MAG: hypothetical protein WBV78_12375 [Roseobacter sp.]